MTRLILHITTAPEWAAAHEAGEYRAPSLETEGFIHCSTPAPGGARRRLVLPRRAPTSCSCASIPAALTSELMWEASADSFAGEFPHVYGSIALAAVDGRSVDARRERIRDPGPACAQLEEL